METPPPSLAPQPEALQPPAMSLFARFSNVIAAPGEAFDAVKAAVPSTATWLVPVLALILVSWIASTVIFANPAVQQQLRDITDQAIQQSLANSNLPQAQLEQAKENAASIARISQSIGIYVSIPFIVFFSTFFWGLMIWALGVGLFKGSFSFMKAVEAAGLCSIIAILDSIIRTLLILVMGNMFAAPSPMLLIKGFNPQNTLHGVLANFELFTLWILLVRAIALARLSGVSVAKAAAWVFGIWVAYSGLFIGLGAAGKAIGAHFSHH